MWNYLNESDAGENVAVFGSSIQVFETWGKTNKENHFVIEQHEQ